MKKFAVLNPMDGTYTYTEDETKRDQLIVVAALQLYMTHVHDTPYSIVEMTEDNKEQWSNPSGEYIPSPYIFEELSVAIHAALNSTEQTPVVTVP